MNENILPRSRQKKRMQHRGRGLLPKKIILLYFLSQSKGFVHLLNNTEPNHSVVSALKSFQITWRCPWYAHTNNFCWLKRNVEKSCFLFWGFGSLILKWYTVSILMIRQAKSRLSTNCCRLSIHVVTGTERHLWSFNHNCWLLSWMNRFASTEI